MKYFNQNVIRANADILYILFLRFPFVYHEILKTLVYSLA